VNPFAKVWACSARNENGKSFLAGTARCAVRMLGPGPKPSRTPQRDVPTKIVSATLTEFAISTATMKSLRSIHLFLGCLFAPMLIFFAVTGSWQLFNWQESKKDKTYVAPAALAALSFIHKDAHIPGTPGRQPTPLRYFMLATALGLVATSNIGIVMAYRFSRRPLIATVCLLAGIAIPGLLLWIYR
jgi:hypothetical protein